MPGAVVGKALLLTGDPGVGKTTLLHTVLSQLHRPAEGFYTLEIREDGERKGFRLVSLAGMTGILAHVDFATPHRISRYGVDLRALEQIAGTTIRMALQQDILLILDEIGPMEVLSPAFCSLVLEALDSPTPIFGTIVKRSTPFTDLVRRHPAVEIIEVSVENRQLLTEELPHRLA